MWSTESPRSNWFVIGFTFAALFAIGTSLYAQAPPEVRVGSARITGIPDDWTHHHVIFANPGTEQEAIESGHYAQWQKIVNEPRYVIQQLKKNLPVQGPAAVDAEYRAQWISEATGANHALETPEIPVAGFGFGPRSPRPIGPFRRPIDPPSEVKRDWSMTSGGTGGLLPTHYPAKYGFLATTASKTQESCSDFVVFPTGILGSSTQATLIAYNNIYKSPTCTGNVPGVLLSINTGGLADTSPILSLDGTQVAFMQTTGSGSVTGTTTTGSKIFTVTTGTINSSEVGSLITGTGIPTGDTIATVTGPTTGTLTTAATTGGTGLTLTISGEAQLVLSKIGTGGGTAVSSPVTPTKTSNAGYRACTGPCYTTFTLFNATAGTRVTDSNSAPFYVYNDVANGDPDILYVGDDLGFVHKFTAVFDGATPAEVTTNWPAHASTETSPILNSPVYDSTSGDIFVGDASGFLHQFAVGTTPGTPIASGHLAFETTGGMDSVVVDHTSGTDYVYQFVGYSDDTGHDRPSYINRFTAGAITAGSFGTSVWYPNNSTATRPAGTATLQRAGTFDNTYFTGSGTTGNIYTCSDGVLYQIPLATITAATPTVNTFHTPTSAAANCSAVSEFDTGTTDWIFMSVAASAVASGGSTCTGACVLNYNVTTSTNTTGTPAAGLAETGGTSGIVIDNAATGGGSEIYFTSTLGESCTGVGGLGTGTGSGTGSCAVQATQSGLQ
jgi:hypothetical protein